MAFENVDVLSLKNALGSCKSSINYSKSKQMTGGIEASGAWICDSELKLTNSITKLVDVRYKDLEKLLDKYIETAGYIEEYKILEEENNSLQNQYNNLSGNLYYTEQYEEQSEDSNGNIITTVKSREVKDYGVEKQMYNITNTINNNKEKMNVLRIKVSNSI